MRQMNYYVPGVSRRESFDKTVNNLFNSLFDQNINSTTVNKNWPRIDIEENNDSFLITAELPGINKEDVKIEVDNNILTISGEKTKEEDDSRTLIRKETQSGEFSRAFSLPEAANTEEISASFKNGILTLTVPKAEKEKIRKIAIS